MKLLPPSNEVWGKVVFLHPRVILYTGGLGSGLDADSPRVGQTPLGLGRPPPMQTPLGLGRPPQVGQTSRGCRPPRVGQTPWGWAGLPWMQTPRGWADPPPPPIRSTSGRYASYWNAHLFKNWLELMKEFLNHLHS